jgi:hypothetical protein
MGTRGSFLGVKWPGSKDDHSPLPTAEVKNGGAIPPFPIRLYGVIIKHMDTFIS